MPKLRHVAIMVPDPEATAEFFIKTFEMQRVAETDSPISVGVLLSDGTVNLAVLRYKDDEAAGVPGGKDTVGINHFGFWVEDLEATDRKIKENGGRVMLNVSDDPEERKTLFFEMKYKDPNGIIIDLSEHGWVGAKL